MTATTVVRGRSSTSTLATARWLLRAVFDIVAEPVRKGRLRGESWHPGLRAAVAFSLVLYVAELALLAAAPLVRAHDDLAVVGTMSLPRSTVFFFVAVVLWCLSLLYAASLHAPVWLRIGSLVLVTLTMATFAILAGTSGGAWVPIAVGAGGLVVLTSARWRRDPAWWEVPLALLLVSGPSLVALALGAARTQSLGADAMPLLLSLQMQRLNALAMPAALLAGAAVAELAVSTAGKVARSGSRFPRFLVPLVLALGVWRLVEVARSATTTGETTNAVWVEWVGATGLLAVASAWGWWLLRPSRERSPAPQPEDAASEVGVVGTPVAIALLALLLPSALVNSAVAVLAAFNRNGQALSDLNDRLLTTTNVTWYRILVGLVLLVLAARLARRGPPARALLLGQIGLVLVVVHLGTVSDGRIRWPWTSDSVVDVAAVAALVGFAWLVLRGRLTSVRAAVLGTIVVIPWAFRFSDVIDEPFVTLLGLGGIGVTLFGLVWAFATGAFDANGDSVRYPRQTRVLLFLAQAIFGLLALVYAAVARGGSALAFSPTETSALGSQVLGVPLILAALVVMVWRLGR